MQPIRCAEAHRTRLGGGHSGGGPIALGEQDVVIGVGVERGVEVDQVDRLAGDVLAQDAQVVAVVERVGREVPGGHDGG
jgi:hypothetical protein